MRALVVSLAAAAGAAAMSLGLALADDGGAQAGASTTAPTTTQSIDPSVWWHDPSETLIGPAAIVPGRLSVERGEAVLTYAVESIASARLGLHFESDDIPPVAPENWELVTATAVFPGSATRASARQVRFVVDEDFRPEDVVAIRVTRHWLRIPYTYDLMLDAVVGAETPIDEGVSLTVEAVLEQSETTLLHLELIHPPGAFGATERPDFWIYGRGTGWGPTNVRVGGGYSLTFFGPRLPDPAVVTVSSSRWIPFDAVTDIDIAGLQHGG
ncbi:MAG: hypothetical protein R3246_11025 [Acidimicrobiia bacterium]|nr:hypothetical protein [Acidimicrobiia bacterium]